MSLDFTLGGGLSVNYSSDAVTPTIEEYASSLRFACPDIFDRRPSSDSEPYKVTIITGEIATTLSQM